MSFKNLDLIDQFLSNSQTTELQENLTQSPEVFINNLKAIIGKNLDLIQEILYLFTFIFPFESNPSLNKLIEDNDMKILNKNSIHLDEKKISSLSDKQAASLLLIIFGLFKDIQELAVFIAKQSSEIWGGFSENIMNLTVMEKGKFIYQGVFEFYRKFEEDVFLKILKFLQNNPKLIFFRDFYLKNIPFRKKVTPDMLNTLLENYDDFNKFICKNSRRIFNEEEVFDRLLLKMLKENEVKTRKLNVEKVLLRFSIKCLESNRESIFNLILKKSPFLMDSMHLFRTALKQKNITYLKKFLLINENSKEILLEEENFTGVLSFFETEEFFLDGIFLLNQIKDKDLNIFYQRVIIEIFQGFLTSTYKSPISLLRIMVSYLNPFALSILLSEIFYQIALRSTELQLKFNFLAVHFRDLAIVMLEKLQKSIKIKPLLTKIFYPADTSVLDILLKAQIFFEIILINPNTHSIFNEMWDSPYDKTFNIMILSTNFCFLTGKLSIIHDAELNSSSFMNQSFSMSPTSPGKSKNDMKNLISSFTSDILGENKGNLFHYFKKADILQKKTNFIFQLKIFYKCMGFRYFLEFLFFLIVFCIILTILMDYLSLLFAINETPKSVMFAIFSYYVFVFENSHDPANMIGKMLTYVPLSQQQTFLYFITHGNFFDNTFACQIILYMKNRTMNIPIMEDLNWCVPIFKQLFEFSESRIANIEKESLMIITTFSSILQLIFYFSKNKKFKISFTHIIDIFILGFTIGLIYLNSIEDVYYFENNFESLLNNMKIVLISLILLIFVKIILFLRMSESMGIPLRIIFKMMSRLFIIIVMLLIIFLSFSVFMHFLFTAKDIRFKTFFSTVKTMFKFMFGEYLNNYSESEIVEYSFFSIMTVGLIFIRIIFLNILIAILSHVYEKIQRKSGLEISLMTHELNDFQDPKEKTLNSLVLIPTPFNFFSFILSPLVLLIRSKKINDYIFKIGYFGVLFVIALLFTLVNFLILPLAWLKILWNIITNNYGGDYELCSFEIKTRIIHFLQWVTLGPFFQFYILFRYDLTSFFKKAFESIYVPSKLDEFSDQEFQILKRMVRIYQEVLLEKNIDTAEKRSPTLKVI